MLELWTLVFQKKFTIVDYGLRNLFSAERAMRYIGADVEITNGEKRRYSWK